MIQPNQPLLTTNVAVGTPTAVRLGQPESPTPVNTELAAMRRLAATLDALDEPTRRRVFGWLTGRYAPVVVAQETS